MATLKETFSSYAESMIPIRRHLHENPELAFEEFETARMVAEMLESWGYEVTTNIGGTGVVGTLREGNGNTAIGLRADMDALPIQEDSGVPHASQTPGKMHACGHDGHTATLLGAAKYLAETRNFSGTLNVIFQPAEEGQAGAKKMIEDGLFDRFPCDEVYALHNAPGVPVGTMGYRVGPAMASNDRIVIKVTGRGGHGSQPHTALDPIVAASAIVNDLQSIVARNVDTQEAAVVTVAAFNAGATFNIIPQTAEMKVSIRTLNPEVRAQVNECLRTMVTHVALAHGCTAEVIAMPNPYPSLFNHAEQTETARAVAVDLLGADAVVERDRPVMGSEDFAFMLQEKPGAYFFFGNGTQGANGTPLHHPGYDFNDDALLPGIAFWGRLVETTMKKS